MPMQLEILLPFRVFASETGVLRIVAQSLQGSFGLLPRRRDCVAALAPGILVYETREGGERWVAVDEGVLVKAGPQVTVSVRRAIAGDDLHRLRAAVDKEFLAIDEQEQTVRSALVRLESGFVRRFVDLQHG
ncbi:F0F1 ATP synthase subunit epsilon [Comamonadaceae bacterium G21597-S1]|nr:F0F1 ATP synthase subunit epsilon [Comamonadaceae bacterium G21597-S1]